jgi:hypothetical protein
LIILIYWVNIAELPAQWGARIYINNKIQSKEVLWFNNLGSDKVFEISVVELLEFHTILACIYRSPESDFYKGKQ